MLATVATYIEQHHLLPENGTVVVAVSGGADSLCLLHVLNRLCGPPIHPARSSPNSSDAASASSFAQAGCKERPAIHPAKSSPNSSDAASASSFAQAGCKEGPGKRYPQLRLHVAHLNHQLRGEESERDAAYVEQIAGIWDLPITIAAVDVLAFARSEQLSLEEAARIARYRFLREVAQGQPIAVAHNADDQVETLLLHLVRGGGLASMVGMQPQRGDIIRPLLAVHRPAILAYCREQAIVPVEDSSNADTHFLRNRIRHELLPLMESMNPAIRATLLRNAEVASVDMQYIEQQVDAIESDVVLTRHDGSFTLSVPALLALPLSLQRHLLRRLTAHLCAGQSPLEPRHYALIEQFLQQGNSGEEQTLQLPARLRLKRTLNTVCIYHLAEDTAPIFSASAGVEMLPIPGQVTLKGTAWLATADVIPVDIMQKVVLALKNEDWPEVWRFLPPNRHTVYIDGDTIDTVLAVRTRRPGDRIHPLGMAHKKKVQDILVDRHIARAERGSIPLFFSADRCIWLADVCIADSVRLTSTTRRIVRLSITASAIIEHK